MGKIIDWLRGTPAPRRYRISTHPVPFEIRCPKMAAKMRERGVEVPTYSSQDHCLAAMWPYEPREPHRIYAHQYGYFWLPCKLCGTPFGGHEIHMTVSSNDPARPGLGFSICPKCTVERTGGELR